MAITKIPAAGFTGNNFRNIIINGDMSIAQRGTSETGLTNGSSGYYTCDRWQFLEGGTPTSVFTQSQSTDVPTGQGFSKSLKMDVTTADSTPDGTIQITQKFEGQNLQYLKKGTSSAESLTCSFWVKSNKTGTYILELEDKDNSRSISKSYTINSSNTWEKKTITFDGDTTGTYDNDNANSLTMGFFLLAGSTWSSGTLQTSWNTFTAANRAVGQVNLADSTSNEWYITGVQLEVGSAASDFEFLPHDVNRDRCERYYTTGKARAEGYRGTAGVVKSMINFRKTMRSSPSISHSSISNDNVGSTQNEISSDGFGYKIVSSSSGNVYQNSTYTADAEL